MHHLYKGQVLTAVTRFQFQSVALCNISSPLSFSPHFPAFLQLLLPDKGNNLPTEGFSHSPVIKTGDQQAVELQGQFSQIVIACYCLLPLELLLLLLK